jgi:hypothetical protein
MTQSAASNDLPGSLFISGGAPGAVKEEFHDDGEDSREVALPLLGKRGGDMRH